MPFALEEGLVVAEVLSLPLSSFGAATSPMRVAPETRLRVRFEDGSEGEVEIHRALAPQPLLLY